MTSKKPFTPKLLAERWGCSAQHIRDLIRRGEIKAFKVGKKIVRIPHDEVEQFEKCDSSNFVENTMSNGATLENKYDARFEPPTVIVLNSD